MQVRKEMGVLGEKLRENGSRSADECVSRFFAMLAIEEDDIRIAQTFGLINDNGG